MPARLRINVFTPLPPAQTDIANVNLAILKIMAESADVHVWTPQEYWEPIEHPGIHVSPFRADALAFWDLNEADANIFHIGNNREMHEDIFDIARRVPGMVVLHDANLHEFALEMYHAGRHATYYEILLRCHGPGALNEAKHALAHGGTDAVLRRYSCALAACARATSILMHNEAEADILREQTGIEVFALPLPYADTVWPELAPRRAPRPPHRLVVFGYLAKNRRVEQILRILAESPMRGSLSLDIYGLYHDPEALVALVEELSLGACVTLHGFVSFAELNAAIADADLVLNLRNPTVGEASGSQLRIWANGAASAVSDHGWYAELPPDCVAAIDPDSEVDDVGHLLIDLCCRPQHYRRMGERGRRHVVQTHDPRAYVARLLDLLRDEPARRSSAMARRLTQQFRLASPAERHLARRATGALFGEAAADLALPAQADISKAGSASSGSSAT